MKYDFDKVINRRGTDSLKWDVKESELPMWVADMDFMTAPAIVKALEKRVSHGVFGYSVMPDKWADAYIRWWGERHHFTMEREWLIFCTGVVPAISSAVRKLTAPEDSVLIQTPVYNIFFNSIINNGRKVKESPLLYKNGEYSVDFEVLEKELSDPKTTLMILCNPHNPVGKIWDRDTLAKIGELCFKHHVTVISDEIHCDLTDPGKEYVPFASVSECCRQNSVTCIAPTKCFNIAGLQTAAVAVPDPVLRQKMDRALNTDEVAEGNAFAADAAIAAFNEGGEWLDELREYIFNNKQAAREFIEKELPQIRLVRSEATYLLWLDCRGVSSREFARFIRERTGLYLSGGAQYGKTGEGFLRMNIACPKSVLLDGLHRLKAAVTDFLNQGQ